MMRSSEEDLILDFLIECFSAGKLLSISDMLKLETDKEALGKYIGKMLTCRMPSSFENMFVHVVYFYICRGGRVLSLSSARMRSFLDQKKKDEKEISVIGKGGDIGTEGA